MNNINECINFINESKTCFHAISNIEKILIDNNFQFLSEDNNFKVTKGNKYYTKRNGSSIIAFNVGDDLSNYGFNLTASHSDSPTFKIKPNSIIKTGNAYKLNTEGYGGMICSSWLDRPLSIAGRVMVKDNNKIVHHLIDFKKPVCLIPSVAIHLNRTVNDGFKYNKQIDMLPIIAMQKEEFNFNAFIAEELNVKTEDVINYDLFLYALDQGFIWGPNNEFLSAPRIDDLECAYTTLKGLLNSNNQKNINVFCCFDNEEVGSKTLQGAASTFLSDVLNRINNSLGYSKDDYYCALANSFMISADNAHAVHPNHSELSDQTNRVEINEGIVIKFNAAQSYTTDSVSSATFKMICDKCNVPYQMYTNRSDLVGGGTLGNVSSSQVSIVSVDIGLGQWSMHSALETCGSKDVEYAVSAISEFYNSNIKITHNQIEFL